MRNAFIQTVKTIAQSMIEKAGFDKTRTGHIVGVNALTNTYSVKVDGHVYNNVRTVDDATYNAHDIVKVIIPTNQATQMYISASVLSDDSLGNKVGRAQALGEENAEDIRTIYAELEELEPQIDAKIETWAQSSDPSTAWTDSETRAKHDDDLWLYTGLANLILGYITIKPQGVYKYDSESNHWEVYSSVSRNIFDLADSKSTIYYGKYTEGTSYPVTPSNGDFFYNTSSHYTYRYEDDSSSWVRFDNNNIIEDNDYLVDKDAQATYQWDNGVWVIKLNVIKGLNDLRDELQEQIDAQIETWAQSTDPSTAWTTSELRESHDSDLWLYTGLESISYGYITIQPQRTYKYDADTNHWVAYSIARNIFDLADSKSTIYYGRYSEGTSYPANPSSGDFFYNTSNTYTYHYENLSWVRFDNNGIIEEDDYLVDREAQSTYQWDSGKWSIKLNITKGLNDLREELEIQIDAKIETWAQVADPSLAWTTSELKEAHNGDLWLYTGMTPLTVGIAPLLDNTGAYLINNSGDRLCAPSMVIKPQGVYQYSYVNNIWEEYASINNNIFDLADGKSTVYYGAPSDVPTADNNDYLIDPETGCTYRFTSRGWVKVTDYQTKINEMAEELERQIDSKIETFAQSTDPSVAWTTGELRLAHNDDLWLYTGLDDINLGYITIKPQRTYKYDAPIRQWVAYSIDKNVFDLADGKSTVFYGKYTTGTSSQYPSNPSEGDFFYNTTSSHLYRYISSQWQVYEGEVAVNDYLVDKESKITYRWDGTVWTSELQIEGWLSDLREDLEEQIDSKIETFAQSTDPSVAWTTGELRLAHNDDLWLYTGLDDLTLGYITIKSQRTYKYNASTNQWENYSVNKNIFDLADSKSTIHYGKYTAGTSYPVNPTLYDFFYNTSTTYTYRYVDGSWVRIDNITDITNANYIAVDDYLVDPNNGSTYKWASTKHWELMTDYTTPLTQIAERIDALGNFWQLYITTNYIGLNLVCDAVLLKNSIDVTNETTVVEGQTVPKYANDMLWCTKQTNRLIELGTGSTLTIAQGSMYYGKVIQLRWVLRDYANIIATNSSNVTGQLTVGSSNNNQQPLIGRTEVDALEEDVQ